MKVLLLEDDSQVARATMRMLRRAFGDAIVIREVKCVIGAIEAIEALVMEPVDLILSDYEVLGGTADELLHWVKAERSDLLPRFVFFSGTRGLDKLHDKVIEKGCTPDEFTTRLRAFIGAVT